MKSKITTFIIVLISIFIIIGVGIFGLIIYDEIIKTGAIGEVKEFVSNITMVSSDADTEDTLTPQVLDTTTEKKTTENNTSINTKKYFYNQLDNYAKIIYNAIEKNKENMKTGTCEIDLGQDIAKLAGTDDGQKMIGDYYQEAIEAYTYDNPEIFYIDFTKLYLNIETTTRGSQKSYRILLNEGKGANYLIDAFSTKNRMDSAVNEIESVKNNILQNKTEDDYQNIKMVHDYLIDNVEYDETLSKPNIYNLYGALINKQCVCEGYSEAFKYIMDSLNIPCVIVSGKATNSEGKNENHAWNYVQLNGSWYAIDCTWDDPILLGGATLTNSVKYQYFLKGSKEFNTSHVISGQMSENGKNFEYPELSVENYK